MRSIPKSFTIVACLLLAGTAAAQSGGGYDLTWSTIDGGGGTSSGGGYEVSGTIGQPDASGSSALTGGGYELTGGFWVPLGLTCTIYAPFDFDEDCDVDLDDLAVFASCALGPKVAHDTDPICQAADIDSDGDVDQDDFAAFQRCFSGANRLAEPDCAL